MDTPFPPISTERCGLVKEGPDAADGKSFHFYARWRFLLLLACAVQQQNSKKKSNAFQKRG
jgi:hypothetical protein